ncbi:MAG: acetoacetate decarboxylase family protein [Acidimicrobiales bacterium]
MPADEPPAEPSDAALPPHAPWRLAGEAVVGWVRASGRPRRSPGLPAELQPSIGRAMVIAVRYVDSPVGPYDELTVAVPARVGLRPGLASIISVVSQPMARRGGQRNWGFPAELGTLRWSADGPARSMHWEERGVEVVGVPFGPTLPFLVPMRSVQLRSDGPVVVPRRLWGLLRLSRVAVSVPEGDPLTWAAGCHIGAHLANMRMLVHPARHPIGLLSSLRAPLGPPEPALAQSHYSDHASGA